MARYAVGNRVRVKAGVTDPDNPDLSIGGWCGVIQEVDASEQPPAYFIRWDERTRSQMAPHIVQRCRSQDLEIEVMWLDEDDLDPDDGALLAVDSFSDNRDHENRLREVFSLSGDEPIPDVDEVSLRIYHAHLRDCLVLPFEARWSPLPPLVPAEPVAVLRLLPPEAGRPSDGLLVEVRIRGQTGPAPLHSLDREDESPQGRLLADYRRWFAERASLPEPTPEGAGLHLPLGKLLHYAGLLGALYGATLGAVLAVMENAKLFLIIGAVVFAVMLGMLGRRWGIIVGALRGHRQGGAIGLLGGAALGAVLGVLLGALGASFLGSIPGSILGSLLVDALVRKGPRIRAKFLGVLVGGCAGGIVLTLVMNHEDALRGLFIGTLAGIASAVLLVLVALLTLAAFIRRRLG